MINRKRAVADCMNRLYARGLTTTSGGNISLRSSSRRVLLTASGMDKASMRPEQILELGLDGTNYTPYLKPSIEYAMHLEVYRRHPGVQAIVHAHPPFASAFTATRARLNTRLVAEGYALIGEPVLAPYALMGTQALADSVADSVSERTPCILMENHGVLCVGKTLLEAFDRVEVLEQTARIQIYVGRLGDTVELNADRCREIDRVMGRGDGVDERSNHV